MESKNGNEQKKPISSVLQGDGVYFNRILSREPSVGQSSHIYYRRTEGVPFKWEMQPGTPKNRPEEEDIIPPLSPPPSVLSLGLPKPCFDHPKRVEQSSVWFWKRIKIIHKEKMIQTLTSKGTRNVDPGLNKNDQNFQLGDQSDGEFIASFDNSCSSSSSSSNSSNSHAMELSSIRRELVDGPFCCSPWNISAILIRTNRRI